jgi:hypothetical protein
MSDRGPLTTNECAWNSAFWQVTWLRKLFTGRRSWAFVHGSRIARDSSGASPQCVYPDRKTSLRLVLGMPLRLAAGAAPFLPHGVFALVAAIEIGALRKGPITGSLVVASITLIATVGLSFAVRARFERPAATWAL